MTGDLHLDPERLHDQARRAAAMLDALVPVPPLDMDAVDALCLTAEGRAALAEVERIGTALGRAGQELGDLTARLDAVAARSRAADGDVQRSLLRLDPRPL